MSQQQSEEEQNKQDLFTKFQDAGIQDNLKLTLRKQLIERFKGINEEATKQNEEQFKSLSYSIQIQIVADFLRRSQLNYTSSIFLPEIQLSSDKVLADYEILESLQIKEDEYKTLDKPSALEVLIHIMKNKKKQTLSYNTYMVTGTEEKNMNIDEKCDAINSKYSKNLDYLKLTQAKSIEEMMIKYKHECEQRFKKDMELEIERIRNQEIVEVRLKESERYQRINMENKREVDKMYQEKLKRLQDREKIALDLTNKKIQELDRMAYEKRQEHQSELDKIYNKTVEFNKHKCMENEIVQEQTYKTKVLEQDLKKKIREYEEATQSAKTQIEKEIARRKNEKIQEVKSYKEFNKEENYKALEEQNKYVNQQRDYIANLEVQRQYLTTDCDSLKKDVQELESMRNQQTSEIQSLRETAEGQKLSQEANLERINSLDKQFTAVNEYNKELLHQKQVNETHIDQKRKEQTELHQNYSIDMETYHNKLIDTQKYHQKKLEEERENNITIVNKYKFDYDHVDEKLRKFETENTDLRKELRYLRKAQRPLEEIEVNKVLEDFYEKEQNSKNEDHKKKLSEIDQELANIKLERNKNFF